MHLRAHGTMNQFFAELKDAPENPGLALCTATVLFVLSQDRLNMDMDRDSLELMLNLLDTDSRIKDALDASGKINICKFLKWKNLCLFYRVIHFQLQLFNQYEMVLLSKGYDI